MIYTKDELRAIIVPMLQSMEANYDAVADAIVELFVPPDERTKHVITLLTASLIDISNKDAGDLIVGAIKLLNGEDAKNGR